MATNRSKIKQQVKGKLGSGKRFKELAEMKFENYENDCFVCLKTQKQMT